MRLRDRKRLNYAILTVAVCAIIFLVTHAPDNTLDTLIRIVDGARRPYSDKTAPGSGLGLWDAAEAATQAEWENDFEAVKEEGACRGWDPKDPSTFNPECTRARQYRQVQDVLEREEKAEHDHWYFTRDHNIATLQRLLHCFLPPSDPEYTACPPKPLIVSGWWYTAESVTEATTGEVIWQKGLFKQAEALGIEYIAVGPYRNWITVAEMMPDVYRVIWNSDIETVTCVTDPRCVAQYVPPQGQPDLSIHVPPEERGVIPIWALNVVDYWGSKPKEISNNNYWWGLEEEGDWSYQPLGQQWVATPWPLPGHVHLPYSIEDSCLRLPYKPHSERNDTVLIFAKRSAYFDYHFVSKKHFWTDLAKEPGFDLLLTAEVEEGHPLPDGLTTLGKQSREGYDELVGSVKVLLGMGAPPVSPSVYNALCQGTPVIVPHFLPEPRTDGWHLYSGHHQHGPAHMIGEPYVYSYYAHNYTELVEVTRRALVTPIERFIPPDMKFSYGVQRLQAYLDRDLEAIFQQVVANNNGTVPRLIKGPRERCYELKRCRDELPPGRIPAAPLYI